MAAVKTPPRTREEDGADRAVLAVSEREEGDTWHSWLGRSWADLLSVGKEKAEQSSWACGGRTGGLGQQAVNERGREFLLFVFFKFSKQILNCKFKSI